MTNKGEGVQIPIYQSGYGEFGSPTAEHPTPAAYLTPREISVIRNRVRGQLSGPLS